MTRKRKQYQLENYYLYDFNDEGVLKSTKKGFLVGIAENQVAEIINAIKRREYIEDKDNELPELIILDYGQYPSVAKVEKLSRNGVYIDGIKYERLVRSGNMTRTGTVSFIAQDIKDEVIELMSLGKIPEMDKVTISRVEAYLGLAFSTTIFIDEIPKNVCVVDDSIFDVIIEEHVKSYKNNKLYDGIEPVQANLFDGMGLHSETYGKKVGKALGLNYTPCGLQIRMLPSIKGMSYKFDFKAFYKERGVTHIKDWRGREWKVEELDCIWSTSMFKFEKYFKSWDEFVELRDEYYTPLELNQIGISKWSDNDDLSEKPTKMSYQYLQSLNLDGDDLIELSTYTKDIVERVYAKDINATKLFLNLLSSRNNNSAEDDVDIEDNDNCMASHQNFALKKNPEMIDDPYIKIYLRRQLKRTITDMKLGRVYVKGQYSFTAQDPVLMLEMIAGLEPVGSLAKGEFYSTGKEGVHATFRSPFIHSSEAGKLNFIHNDKTDKWLHKYKNIIVLNGFDLTAQQHGGSDFDGDTYMITKNEKIVNSIITHFKDGRRNNMVIDITEQENKAKAIEEEYTLDNIIQFDLRTLDNQIGRLTNIATWYTNLAQAEGDISSRDAELIYSRLLSAEEIDFAKSGIRTLKVPEEFTEIETKPYFLQKYKYGKDEKFQQDIENAPLNLLCKHIERWEETIYKNSKHAKCTMKFLKNQELINEDKEKSKEVYRALEKIFEEYKQGSKTVFFITKDMDDEKKRSAIFSRHYREFYYKANELTDDKELLSSIAVHLTYGKNAKGNSVRFPWVVAWEGMALTIERTSPEFVDEPVPMSEIDQEELILAHTIFEFLGVKHAVVKVRNNPSADKYIELQNEKQIEKDRIIETSLYGFNERSYEEVKELIENGNLMIGETDYDGNLYPCINDAEGNYIGSVRLKGTILALDEGMTKIGDLSGRRVKVEYLDVSKSLKSMYIKMELVA